MSEKFSLIKYLRRPYPYPEKAWTGIVTISVLVFVILFIFQPFGITSISPARKIRVLLGYGVVTALVMSILAYVLPPLLPSFYNERRWTVGRHILNGMLTLVLITFGNVAYGYVFNITWQHFNLSVFLSAFIITVSVGIFPVVLITVFQQNRLLSLSLREANQINHSLVRNAPPLNHAENEEIINLTGSGKEDVLQITTGQLLYMEAFGNYVKVHYCQSEKAAQKTLRTTIKQMEDATKKFPHIIKCHRAFIVNLDKVTKVNGNSQGYRLMLTDTAEEIPVSRGFTQTVKSKIGQFST